MRTAEAKPGRIPCVNPRCRRTAPADRFGTVEFVCGKCWRTVPPALRKRYRTLNRRQRRVLARIERRIARGTIALATVDRIRATFEHARHENWSAIGGHFLAPARPIGLDGFLQELGLA